MAYDDGYYYGQCKIVAVVDDAADNDKTVLITTDDNKTYSGTIANKKCEFLLPPRTLYTVQKVSGESAEFTTKVEAGYGDCILVHLDTGYVEVKQGDIVGLDYIKAATADDLKNKVPEANAVKELNSSLTKVRTYVNEEDGKLHFVDAKGADSVIPFSSGNEITKIAESINCNGGTVNCTSLDNYGSLTISNFILDVVKTTSSAASHASATGERDVGAGGSSIISKNYNSQTGILTISGGRSSGSGERDSLRISCDSNTYADVYVLL